jgi:hypothetical protein
VRAIDISGQRFGMLVVVDRAVPGPGGAQWNCLCDCGNAIVATSQRLRVGDKRTCGCSTTSLRAASLTKHGGAKIGGAVSGRHSPEYSSWLHMNQRCTNERFEHYDRYGGRGIRVCDRWRNSFQNFLLDMGPKPTPRHTIEREDNDGHYEPGNCVWATRATQSANTSRAVLLTVDGVTLSQKEWGERTGLGAKTIAHRLRRGKSAEEAVRAPRVIDRRGQR